MHKSIINYTAVKQLMFFKFIMMIVYSVEQICYRYKFARTHIIQNYQIRVYMSIYHFLFLFILSVEHYDAGMVRHNANIIMEESV